MSSVILSSGVRSSLASLQQTNDLFKIAQNRLSTGKRVNSAFDNPAVFFAASALDNRAADLSSVMDGITGAFKVLESTNNSITSLTNLVTAAQSTARSALASPGTTAKTIGTVSGLSGASSFTVVAPRTITVNDGTTTATITSAGAVTVQQILDGINNTANLKVKASLTSDGRLQLEATGTNTIVLGGTITAPELAQYGLTAGTTVAGTLNTSRSALAAQFDATRAQIDQITADANFNGVNLLTGGSLKVTFNEKSTTALNIAGVTDTAAGLGIVASTNTFQTDKDINDALNNLTNALATLRTQSAVFSSNLNIVQVRQDFTKTLIDTLKGASDSMVAADQNEESANLLALQTRQSLSSTALSLAAQADQSVLRLFG
jgi:flagellin-like hook-associated protein FlgL